MFNKIHNKLTFKNTIKKMIVLYKYNQNFQMHVNKSKIMKKIYENLGKWS